MSTPALKVARLFPQRVKGASPSEDRYYVVILFDISDPKKYRALIHILNSYATRIQKSVFEALMKGAQIEGLISSIERLMSKPQFFNSKDNIRIYKVSGHCDITVFGECTATSSEENIFI